jgi:taspase (threonine aspartase 1)
VSFVTLFEHISADGLISIGYDPEVVLTLTVRLWIKTHHTCQLTVPATNMSQSKPIITVTGATGSQGGAVVQALLKRDKFRVRAVTRNPESSIAKALASHGCEVVKADMTDKASLVKAFEGAHGAFLVTDFLGSCQSKAEKELEQGRCLADAAKEAGLKHVVWSTLEDPRPFLDSLVPDLKNEPGRKVSHFETKAEIQHYIDRTGLPATHLITSGFYNNVLKVPYQKAFDDSYVWAHNGGQNKPAPWVATETIGGSAAVAFEEGGQSPGNVITCMDEMLSNEEVAEILSKVTRKSVRYQELPDEVMRGFPFPAAEDVANMFCYYKLHEKDVRRLRPEGKRVVPVTKFADWAAQHKTEVLDALQKADAAQQ